MRISSGSILYILLDSYLSKTSFLNSVKFTAWTAFETEVLDSVNLELVTTFGASSFEFQLLLIL